MNEQIKEQETKSVVIQEPKIKQGEITMWNDAKLYNQSLQMAQQLSKSNLLPQAYQSNPSSCLIAIDIANRLNISPMFVMQNSQIVKGNFTWKGSACKAMIDACGKYQSTRYVEVGEKGIDTYGIYLEAIDLDGNIVKGVTVTIGMAKAEGWYQKDGSKWRSLSDLMLRYRAAAFFFRTECASIAMGFLTKEEIEDIYGSEQRTDTQKVSVVDMLNDEIYGEVEE